MKNTLYIALALGIAYLIPEALEKEQSIDCYDLDHYSKEFADQGFYYTQAEAKACKALGFIINAPIK